ncbi:uncharacterized protein [Equus przewalskii]|uniref:Uncharacterized protein n=1 Tax=Equus przewalskii TaxID=9798 RepID=A0ABM4LZB4_EQUPR
MQRHCNAGKFFLRSNLWLFPTADRRGDLSAEPSRGAPDPRPPGVATASPEREGGPAAKRERNVDALAPLSAPGFGPARRRGPSGRRRTPRLSVGTTAPARPDTPRGLVPAAARAGLRMLRRGPGMLRWRLGMLRRGRPRMHSALRGHVRRGRAATCGARAPGVGTRPWCPPSLFLAVMFALASAFGEKREIVSCSALAGETRARARKVDAVSPEGVQLDATSSVKPSWMLQADTTVPSLSGTLRMTL